MEEIVAAGSPPDVAQLAMAWRDAGNFEDSLALLRAALGRWPQVGGLWHNFGLLLADLDRHTEAIDAFTRALKWGYPSLSSRGYSYESDGNVDLAKSDYQTQLALDPDDLESLINLGTLELELGDVDSAESHLVRAAEIDPIASWQLADVYLARADETKAIEALHTAIDSGEAKANVDLANLMSDDLPEAEVVELYEKAIAADAAAARGDYAMYLFERGHASEAEAVARSGIAVGDWLCFAPLGVILESEQRMAESLEAYRSAVDNGDFDYEEDVQRVAAQLHKDAPHGHEQDPGTSIR